MDCEYDGVPRECHRGKIEFHHPISRDGMVGVYLCESHHSLAREISGWRTKKYPEEMLLNMSLEEIRDDLIDMVHRKVLRSGHKIEEIDKN